jgi:hypothetical protein
MPEEILLDQEVKLHIGVAPACPTGPGPLRILSALMGMARIIER